MCIIIFVRNVPLAADVLTKRVNIMLWVGYKYYIYYIIHIIYDDFIMVRILLLVIHLTMTLSQ